MKLKIFISKGYQSKSAKSLVGNDFDYILEIDLQYPETLHNDHNDLPFCCENITPPNGYFSKLIPKLFNKQNFLIFWILEKLLWVTTIVANADSTTAIRMLKMFYHRRTHKEIDTHPNILEDHFRHAEEISVDRTLFAKMLEERELQEQPDKFLFFEFSYDSKAMEGQKITAVPQAKIVPVTTRSIGFAAQNIYIRISRTVRNLPPCTIYQLYRVSLAQFEFRASRALHNNNKQKYVTHYRNLHQALKKTV